jgi:hypothetical protein
MSHLSHVSHQENKLPSANLHKRREFALHFGTQNRAVICLVWEHLEHLAKNRCSSANPHAYWLEHREHLEHLEIKRGLAKKHKPPTFPMLNACVVTMPGLVAMV